MKDKRILNNKIGIEIVVLIIGAVVFAMGILEAIYNNENYFYISKANYNNFANYGHLSSISSLWVGIAITFLGVLMMIVSSIKIANLCLLKKGILPDKQVANVQKIENTSKEDYKVNIGMQSLRSEIMYAQNMRNDGLLTDEEFENLRKDILSKPRI